MSTPGKSNAGTIGLVVGAVATLGLLGAILFGGGPDSPSSPGSPSTEQVRPRLAQMRQPTDEPRLAAAAEGMQREPPAHDRTSSPLPLVAQLKNDMTQQRLAQLRVHPGQRELVGGPETAANAAPPPTSPAPTGTLSKESIQAAIREVIPAARRCYESSLKMKPDSRGVVKVGFTIVASDGGGAISDAEVMESDLANPVADACLLDAFASAHFPVPEGGGSVRVTYPIKLESGASAP